MAGLFGDEVATVTRLTPDRASPLWVHVLVEGKRAARVPAAKVEALGLAVGVVWSMALVRRAGLAAEVLKAKLKAVGLLRVRARSSAELAGRLVRQGFSGAAAQGAIAELTQERLIDDEALAEARVRGAVGKGIAAGAVSEGLGVAGLAETRAAADVAGIAGTGNELERAIEQARNRAARIPESLGAPGRYRRVLAALARLGYDEEVAREAADKALGPLEG